MSTQNDGDGGGIGYSFDDEQPFNLDTLLTEKPTEEKPDPGKETAESLKAARDANVALVKQLESMNTQLEEVRKNTTGYFPTAQPAPVVDKPAIDMEALKLKMGRELIEDPGAFAMKLMAAAEQTVQQEVAKRTDPLLSGGATTDINAFLREHSDEDPEVLAEVRKALSAPNMATALGQQDSTNRAATLNFILEAADGRVERARRKNGTRRNDPPDLGGGQTLSTVGNGAAGTMYKGKPLSSEQKEVLRAATEAGISDPTRLKKLLDAAASNA